jgi:transcriptional regulator CtsR
MKKITDIILEKRFTIDPSIVLEGELDEMVRTLKINVISYSDNEEILTNLYYTMRTYLNDAVVDDILKSCLDKLAQRDLLLSVILKK